MRVWEGIDCSRLALDGHEYTIHEVREALQYKATHKPVADLTPAVLNNLWLDYCNAGRGNKETAPQAFKRIVAEAVRKYSSVQPPQEATQQFGCHCDIESMPDDFIPDECVIGNEGPDHCIYAQGLIDAGKDKWQCVYWRKIEKKDAQIKACSENL